MARRKTETRRDRDEAVRLADDLVRRLGPGWKPRVWENIGWHYAAHRLGVNIREDLDMATRYRYTAYASDGVDSVGGIVAADGTTPQEALRGCVDELDKRIDALRKASSWAESWADEMDNPTAWDDASDPPGFVA